jgi:hypothetical protein
MKKDKHPVDDLFREVLQNHTVTPSAEAREAFLKESAGLQGNRGFSRKWIFLGLGLILVVISGTLLYTGMSLNKANKITPAEFSARVPAASVPEHVPAPVSKSQPAVGIKPILKASPVTSTPAAASPVIHKNSRGTTASGKTTSQQPALVSSPPEAGNSAAKVLPETPATDNSIVNEDIAAMTLLEFPGFNLTADESPSFPEPVSAAQGIYPAGDDKPVITNPKPRGYRYSTSASYSPEWMFNTLDGTKYVNNVAVEQTFHFREFSIRTGLGASVTQGTNQLLISYNDYLGSFQKLDSMTFSWNPGHTELIPTYYLSNQEVWDSLMSLESTKIVKRYTYLQVPVIFGYDFWSNRNFSVGVRIGPVISFLLSSNQLSEAYDPGKNRIVMINQITPERIQTNVQLMGGLSAGYSITHNLGIELEPEFRYYFNSVYEKSGDSKKPWSAGFRFAFVYKY